VVVEERLDMFDLVSNDESVSDGLASKIVVWKSKRALVLLDEAGNVISRHRISLGKNAVGTKLKQGDYKTPEGTYRIIDKRSDPKYYKEMLLSYPNAEDRERSRSLGFSPGGGVTIHAQVPWNWDGHGNDFTLSNDWTEGCISVTNEGMDMIWNNIALGTTIEIKE
jgi:murein L,D-transpeptidase YafK